ncbi:MAG: cell division protein FtsA [Alphaproteobacteria bacterium]|nr:cell division protein FtsA [Alphaproteobacteria bacterium]
MKAKSKSIYTFLDIGTFKISCLMARMAPGVPPEIIGHSYVQSKGIQGGAIWDIEAAKLCVDNALRRAEKSAGRRITSVYVNVSSSQIKSEQIYQEIDIPGGRAITAEDVESLIHDMLRTHIPPNEEILHVIPVGYTVDQEKGRTDPRGMHGNTLGARIHVITIPETQTLNLLKVLDWCHVTIAGKVATPYASALAVLNEDEMDLGTTVIDFGAGTTSYAIMIGGGLMQLGLIPIGGNQITRALAQTFNTDLLNAEKEKIRNGAVIAAPRDEVERVILPVLGDDTGTNVQVRRADLIQTIEPIVDDILNQVGESLTEDATFSSVANRYVLTGGGSGFEGLVEKTGDILGGIARLGKIQKIKNLPNENESCRFNVCVGLLILAQMRMQNKVFNNYQEKPALGGWLGKVKEWLKQNL